MRRKIFKYEISPDGEVSMPLEAQILSIHSQDDKVFLWTLVDITLVDIEQEMFTILPTGATGKDELGEYAATVHLHGGGLVFHLFYKN